MVASSYTGTTPSVHQILRQSNRQSNRQYRQTPDRCNTPVEKGPCLVVRIVKRGMTEINFMPSL